MSGMNATEQDLARTAIAWRKKYEALWEAVELLWWFEPGEAGYEAVLDRLERVWREEGES